MTYLNAELQTSCLRLISAESVWIFAAEVGWKPALPFQPADLMTGPPQQPLSQSDRFQEPLRTSRDEKNNE